ncbi:MAG: hypothetical protein OXM02_02450 [Bacteroidota bacterium]|nr:hypothetical protein [Bacteroidota bacterium]MDE2833363.1 hypothetical protein [Bacteroidota bacterium]MDE2957389.1 hypothetical protein [Bacteroidota bacterium]
MMRTFFVVLLLILFAACDSTNNLEEPQCNPTDTSKEQCVDSDGDPFGQ